jgi:hypothetical protein
MTARSSSTFVASDGDGYELVMGRWSRRLAQGFLDFDGEADGPRSHAALVRGIAPQLQRS